MTKTCIECGDDLPENAFYRNKGHADNLSSRCIRCTKIDMQRRWRAKHPEPPAKDGLKPCPVCEQRLPKTEFYKNRAMWDGLQSVCKACQISSAAAYNKANRENRTAYQREWQRKNPDKRADIHLRARLGLPHGAYATMLADQDGKCGVCQTTDTGKMRRFHVDHNRESGAIRGLLCGRCNTGIGQMRHSKQILLAAVEYLDKYHPSNQVKEPVLDAELSMRHPNC